ncbi:MAG: oxidoreductase [Thermogutta sp.]
MARIAWVTGASSGIGRAIALHLSQAGYRVFASARRGEKLEKLRSNDIVPLPLDVGDARAVADAAGQIADAAGKLDVLVNNAGFGLYGTIEGASDEDVRRQFEVNVFGLGRVTRAALPLLRRGELPTVVNVSSVVGKLALPFAGWYSATKHAVEAISDALRLETAPLGIRVVVIEPGAIKTDFDATALALLDAAQDPSDYHPARRGFREAVVEAYRTAPGPEIVARTVLRAVQSKRPRRRYATPGSAKAFTVARRLLPDSAFDWILCRVLRLRRYSHGSAHDSH